MIHSTTSAAAEVDARLRRDGITVDDEERARLIAILPTAQDWIRQLQFDETRYAEPALTHQVK